MLQTNSDETRERPPFFENQIALNDIERGGNFDTE